MSDSTTTPTSPEGLPDIPPGWDEGDFAPEVLPLRGIPLRETLAEPLPYAIAAQDPRWTSGDGIGGKTFDTLPLDWPVDPNAFEGGDVKEAFDASGFECERHSVGFLGEIFTFTDNPSDPESDTVMFDLDDTIVSYTEQKRERDDRFAFALTHHWGLEVAPETQQEMIAMTNEFARWPIHDRLMYNIDGHIYGLMYAVNLYAEMPEGTSDSDYLDELKSGLHTLSQHTHTYVGGERPEMDTDLPLYFYYDTRLKGNQIRLIDQSFVDVVMEEVFEPMYSPSINEDVLEAMVALDALEAEGVKVNIGIFTYGGTTFQLNKGLKVLEIQAEETAGGKRPIISELWSSLADKGNFLTEAQGGGRSYFKNPPNSVNAANEGETAVPQSFVLLDDATSELEGVLEHAKRGLRPAAIRYHRPGTKNYGRYWPEHEEDPLSHRRVEHDSESPESLTERILTVLLDKNLIMLQETVHKYTDPDDAEHEADRIVQRAQVYLRALKKLKTAS